MIRYLMEKDWPKVKEREILMKMEKEKQNPQQPQVCLYQVYLCVVVKMTFHFINELNLDQKYEDVKVF